MQDDITQLQLLSTGFFSNYSIDQTLLLLYLRANEMVMKDTDIDMLTLMAQTLATTVAVSQKLNLKTNDILTGKIYFVEGKLGKNSILRFVTTIVQHHLMKQSTIYLQLIETQLAACIEGIQYVCVREGWTFTEVVQHAISMMEFEGKAYRIRWLAEKRVLCIQYRNEIRNQDYIGSIQDAYKVRLTGNDPVHIVFDLRQITTISDNISREKSLEALEILIDSSSQLVGSIVDTSSKALNIVTRYENLPGLFDKSRVFTADREIIRYLKELDPDLKALIWSQL